MRPILKYIIASTASVWAVHCSQIFTFGSQFFNSNPVMYICMYMYSFYPFPSPHTHRWYGSSSQWGVFHMAEQSRPGRGDTVLYPQGPRFPHAQRPSCPHHHGGTRYWNRSVQIVLAGSHIREERGSQDPTEHAQQPPHQGVHCMLSVRCTIINSTAWTHLWVHIVF